MPVFTINNNRIISYEGNEKSVTIPAGITRIGTGAFKGKNVEEIIFEDGASLKSIDDEAFADCKALKSVLIPNGVVQIGDRAFSGCKSLLYIRIPSSVLLVGEDVLFGHSLDLVIIGEKGTEAEAIATKYGITLQGDEQRAIKAVQAAEKGKSSVETRSFEILGETVTCSNTLAIYQEAIEYYASRKEPFFTSYIELFPTDLNVRKPDVMAVFEPEMDRTVDRLAKQGVLTTKVAIRNKYLLEPYTMTVDGLKAILNLQKDTSETAVSNMSSMQEKLVQEAESKVTGLSYGVIGDGLDLLAYSIDDFATRQRQRSAAYAEADRKLDQYKRDQRNQCDKLIADAMKQIMPTLRKISDLIIEKLLEAEIDLLTEAEIIEENATKGIDIQKSAQLIHSVIGKRDDNTFTAVLAIKKYPCNVAALTYVYEHNPSCTELKDLIQFLGMSNQVVKSLSDSKKSRLNSYISDIKNVSTASQGINLIQKEIALFSDDEIKKMLSCVAQAITPKIEAIALGEKSKAITDTKEYCTIELNKILTQKDWDYLESHGVSPIAPSKIPHNSITSHSLLLEWLSSKLSEMMVRNQKYEKYLEKYPLKSEEEKTRSELKKVQEKISKSQTKTSEQEIVSVLKRVFGVILIIGGLAVGAAAQNVVMGLVVAVPGFLVFLSVFMPPKELRTLRKEEKVLTAQISEIEKLPPFIEDDKKQKDAEAKYEAERLENERQTEEAAKKRKRIIAIITTIVVVCVVFVIVLINVIIPMQKHNKAMSLLDSGDYDAAYALLMELGKSDEITLNKYERAKKLLDSGDYDAAYVLLSESGHFSEIASSKYERAIALLDSGDYDAAYVLLSESGHVSEIALNKYERAMKLIDSGDYDAAYALLEEAYRNSEIDSNKYDRAMALMDSGNYDEAWLLLNGLNYLDSADKADECKYCSAMELYNSQQYGAAYYAFNSINYKDSATKAAECVFQKQKAGLTNVTVGSTIRFGLYEQDNDASKEEIEWIVLAVDGDKALIISKCVLASQPYNSTLTDITWEECSLRTWLNETFYNDAFSADHQEMIISSTVSADENPMFSVDPGNSTTDKVFLLSISDVNEYFGSDSDRRCYGTTCLGSTGYYWWLLRSPGSHANRVSIVYGDSVSSHGEYVNRTIGVRPAMWINLES